MSEVRMIDANKLKNDVNAQVSILNALSVSTGIDELRQIGEELQRGMFAEIDKQPTVNAVPVVRCKDCLYHTDAYPYDEEDELIPSNAVFCRHFEVIRDKNWFCADGERKTE